MAIQAPPHGRPTGATHATVTQRAPMAASLRSLPPVPAAFRRSRASSSPSSSSSSAPKARFVARRSESVSVQQLSRPLALAEYVSLPTSQCSVHKGGLFCPVPLRPWRGEGSRGRRRYAGRRATGRAEEPMSAPAAAPAAQPTGASPGKAVVPDDEFSLAKVSFGVIGLGVGISLLSYGFGSYFNLLPGSEWSALLLTYGFPLTIIGMALKYAELKPVPCTTYADAFAIREKCATPILKQVRSDVTRYRYGDEQHLDEALQRIFQYGLGGGVPRRNAPILQNIREEVTEDGKYSLVLVFEAKALELSDFERRQAKFTSFFGPGIKAEIGKGGDDLYEVRLISETA
ncbi:thylakoid membrane protein slr0575-like [Panicum virgatum]|nr:thylakoid membrane protein slr0575-like [Panicum virgatum]